MNIRLAQEDELFIDFFNDKILYLIPIFILCRSRRVLGMYVCFPDRIFVGSTSCRLVCDVRNQVIHCRKRRIVGIPIDACEKSISSKIPLHSEFALVYSQSCRSIPFSGKLTIVGFFSSTKLLLVNLLIVKIKKLGNFVNLYLRNFPAVSCVFTPLYFSKMVEMGTWGMMLLRSVLSWNTGIGGRSKARKRKGVRASLMSRFAVNKKDLSWNVQDTST